MGNTKGYAAANAKSALGPFTFDRRQPREHDVAIGIKFCGICHSDIHQVRNEWGNSVYPMVPGHEIAGIVTAIGSKVTKFKPGDKVGVGCFVDSCRHCAQCRSNEEQYCPGLVVTYNYRTPQGELMQGGYSEKIAVDENYVLRMPESLPLDASAPLLCAGITLYSPLKHWSAGPGKKVAIIGLGGLGHMGVKLAHAMGAEVTVLSQSLKKQADGKRMGADQYFATSDEDTFAKLQNYFDLVLNTVSSDLDWNKYLSLVNVDGTMVLLGVPEKPVPMGAFPLISGRRSLAGSMIGGIRETQEMLDFCGKHNTPAEIEMIPIQKVNEAYERILKSDVRYRFVIDMASLKAS
ncbi:MAG TPA: NAD(P)-dependent alcohol dehydrogenase [Candidatus Aquilonibacter sp.]|nr:NAD(P)-dependent alcohol dehydrogenase [Candidatus Aquilonibacter sp.]